MKKNLFLLTALGMAIMVMGNANAASLQQIKQNDVIRIGVSPAKPPFGFVGGDDGDSIGFEAVLAHAIAKDLLGDPDKIDFVLLESPERIPALENDKVDLILANFSISDKRKEKVDFSLPYAKNRLGILSRKDKPIKSLQQLDGKTVIVPKNTIAEYYFREHYPNVHLKVYDDNADAFIHFRNGEGDALSQNNSLLFPWADDNPNFVVSIAGFGKEFYLAPAVQKGNTELLDFVNAEMKKFRHNGVIDGAYEKYLRPAFSQEMKKEDILFTDKDEKKS